LSHLPLRGLKILNLASNLPGPLVACRLQALGGEVVKAEPPGGDPLAFHIPAWYEVLVRRQKIVSLDLKTESGRSGFNDLLAASDLLLTANRPAALRRLGLDWESLRARFPGLCYIAIIGYPSPHENRPGHDLTYQAELGLVDPPHLPRALLADMVGAEQVVSAALGLLLARERGAGGGYMEVPLSGAVEYLAQSLSYGLTVPGGYLGGGLARYNLYQAQDGWVALAALEPHFWDNFCKLLNLSPDDPSVEDLARIFKTRSASDWQTWGSENDLPLVAVVEPLH